MEMNTNLFVKDITLPTDVEMLTAEDIAVVSVQEPKQEKEEVAEDTESSEAEESPDTDEKPAEDKATEESSERAKDDAGDEG